MRCPKCQFDHQLQTTECLKCGIVFSRYHPENANPAQPVLPVSAAPPAADPAASWELKYRALAVPSALLGAYLLSMTGLRLAAGMLAMVLHESGHAITAWLTGRWAVPLLWVTPHGEQRSWWIVLAVTAAIVCGGFLAWRTERWGWMAFAGILLIAQLAALSSPAGPLIVFFGDGGAMVLATALMAAFYAPRESAVSKSWGLRWGLLAIGAVSFVHVFRIWTGPFGDIPFGEIEGVNLSDPSLLTEMYGWPIPVLVDRYIRLGAVCLVALATVYVWGLISVYLEVRQSASPEIQST